MAEAATRKHLSAVTSGVIKNAPVKVCINGVDGVGKSTFAADFPNPIFIGPENGTATLDVARMPSTKTVQDIHEQIQELIAENHDYKTIVIDSVDWVEHILRDKVASDKGKARIDDIGYNKGPGFVFDEWRAILRLLDDAHSIRKMNVVLVSHVLIKGFDDPQHNKRYDRYILKVYEGSAALIREFCEDVLFATYKVSVTNDENKSKAKAFGDGVRVMYTERRPAFDAKNRHGLPFELPLSYESYMAAVEAGVPQDVEESRRMILELIQELKKDEVKDKVMSSVEKAGDNAKKMMMVLNRLRTVVSEQQ